MYWFWTLNFFRGSVCDIHVYLCVCVHVQRESRHSRVKGRQSGSLSVRTGCKGDVWVTHVIILCLCGHHRTRSQPCPDMCGIPWRGDITLKQRHQKRGVLWDVVKHLHVLIRQEVWHQTSRSHWGKFSSAGCLKMFWATVCNIKRDLLGKRNKEEEKILLFDYRNEWLHIMHCPHNMYIHEWTRDQGGLFIFWMWMSVLLDELYQRFFPSLSSSVEGRRVLYAVDTVKPVRQICYLGLHSLNLHNGVCISMQTQSASSSYLCF